MLNTKRLLQVAYKYCPRCGTRFDKKKIHKDIELVCPDCGFIFFLNSKPTASCCLVTPLNEILLTKRGINPFKGRWDIPGGFLNLGELPENGLRREMKEELHMLLPKKLQFIGVYIDTYPQQTLEMTLNFYYLARVPKSITFTTDDDVTDARWFSLAHLPKIAFKNGRAALRDLKKFRRL